MSVNSSQGWSRRQKEQCGVVLVELAWHDYGERGLRQHSLLTGPTPTTPAFGICARAAMFAAACNWLLDYIYADMRIPSRDSAGPERISQLGTCLCRE